MSNRKATVTQAELTRYLKSFRDADTPVARTEICDGKVIIFTVDDPKNTQQNDWDQP